MRTRGRVVLIGILRIERSAGSGGSAELGAGGIVEIGGAGSGGGCVGDGVLACFFRSPAVAGGVIS